MRSLLGRARNAALSAVSRRNFSLGDAGPIVSFTFDDFPRSALTVGGKILKDHGVRGTYYAAMGLMGQTNELGAHFTREDLDNLVRDGHEVGSHTYGHLSCRSTPFQIFRADVLKGNEAVAELTGMQTRQAFSYPYGHVTFRAKATIGAGVSSCRSIVPGINISPVDLNFLRANNLYSDSWDPDAIDRLLHANEKLQGWLVFYTHDISENPSGFGCTPDQLEKVVRRALETGARVQTVGEATAVRRRYLMHRTGTRSRNRESADTRH